MMTCRRLLAGAPGAALFLLLASACAHPTQAAQQGMPPRTQDRPLQDRIRSGERPERDSWQKPDEVVQALGLKNGDVVADIGAGTVRIERGRHEWEAVDVPPGDMYRAELEHFLTCIARRRPPLVDLGTGRRTLEIVLLAKASAADGLRRALR